MINKDILYFASDEVARSYKWYDNAKYLSPEVQVISIKKLAAIREIGLTLPKKITADSVLVRSPFYPDRYYDIKSAEDMIIREKIGALSKIAQKLGASKIVGHVELLEEEELDKCVNGQIKYKAVELSANYKEVEQQRYNSRYELADTFPNAIFTEETYKDALALLNDFNLQDPEIKDLVDMRQPGELNTIGSQKVHVAISEEINAAKEFAASLTVMGEVFKLGVNTSKTISRKKTFVYETEIIF